MTERLHFRFSLSCIGEGNGNPLQYSCLENPRDRGAWWAAIYGVTQSWTQLKRLSSSSSSRVKLTNRNCIYLKHTTVIIIKPVNISITSHSSYDFKHIIYMLSLKFICIYHIHKSKNHKVCIYEVYTSSRFKNSKCT